MRKLFTVVFALVMVISGMPQSRINGPVRVNGPVAFQTPPSGGGGSTSLGVSCHNFAPSGAGTSCTLTGVLANSTIVVAVLASGATINSISDGSAYTVAPSSTATNGAIQTSLWARCNVSAGNYTPALTLSTGAESDIWAWEVRGASTSCPNFDVAGIASANGSSMVTASATTTVAGDFVAAVGSAVTQSVTVTNNAPWTGDTIQNGNGAQYQVNVSNGTSVSSNLTLGGTSNYAASLASIKAQ